MTESNLTYYIAILALIIIGVIAAKKLVGCVVKSIVLLVLLALAAAIYWNFLR